MNHVTIWGSLVWYFVLDYFYNYVIGGPYVGSLTQAIKDLTFWMTMLITVVMLMAPVLAYKFYLLDVYPSLSDKVMRGQIFNSLYLAKILPFSVPADSPEVAEEAPLTRLQRCASYSVLASRTSFRALRLRLCPSGKFDVQQID